MGLIKKYETSELIGAGSLGSVYRARDVILDRDVALKILHPPADLDPELKERFYRAARIGANLRHPNVVIVYELDAHNGLPFMAMELLSGADLHRYIFDRRPMSLAQKVELFAQVCDGLAEAHRRGIVHRDIKPSNIFIHEKGTAKILDFGIERMSGSRRSTTGKVLGTPNYMAPEQISRGQCDSRSDLFSAAIVFFEFLVYAHPFQSSFIPRRIVVDGPDSLLNLDPLIPQSLEDLLHKALQKSPESRIQTAEEFAAGMRAVLRELRTALADEPVTQNLSAAPTPHPTPITESSPDSPDGRLAGFVQLLCDFEGALQAADVVLASSVFVELVRLEAFDDRFSEVLLECRDQLERLQQAPPPAAKAAAAAAGASHSAPASNWAPADPTPNGFTAVPPESRSRENARSALDDRTTLASVDVLERLSPEPQEPSSLVCGYCGAGNRASAAFCYNCAMPIDQLCHEELPKESPAEVPAHALAKLKKYRDKLLVWQAVLSRRTREFLAEAERSGRKAWVAFSTLPRNTQYAAGALLGVGLVVIALLIVLGTTKPIPIERSLGTAAVKSAATPLLETEAPSGKRIDLLPRGTQLNVLRRIADPGQRLVRVQIVTPRPSRPGFVALADLGHFNSGDPVVAWEFLRLGRPGAAATPEAARTFSQALTVFSERFPGTPQAMDAALEQVQIHLRLAKQAKAAGMDRTVWQGDLDQARKAMDAAGIREPGPDEEKRLFSTPADFTTWVYKTRTRQLLTPPRKSSDPAKPDVQAESARGAQAAASTANSVEVAGLLKRTSAAWHGGDLDSCERYARQILTLAPDNKKAKAWLWQVDEARRQ